MDENKNKIISVLNSRGVRREQLDSETLKDIENIISACGAEPIKMVGYWGVGEKQEPTEIDRKALDKLSEIMKMTDNRIKVHLILADKHGEFNGYENDIYLDKISVIAEEKNISTAYLSAIYREVGLDAADLTNVSDDIWNKFPECYRCIIEKRAGIHQKKCEASEDAKRYLHMTQVEKQKIGAVYPNCIWFTYGDIKNLKDLFPRPVISIWPVKRGKSVLPWFTSG